MTVKVKQVYHCDLCQQKMRELEGMYAAPAVAQVIQTDIVLKYNGSLYDVCSDCWKILMDAYRDHIGRSKSDDDIRF